MMFEMAVKRWVNYSNPPELRYGHMPIWCHHHCIKMSLVPDTSGHVLIKGSAASLKVRPAAEGKGYWRVSWRVQHALRSIAGGSTVFTTQALVSAVGFSNLCHRSGRWMIDRYGGTCAEQGTFIRHEDFLNVPGPGTGHDGDPNVSVQLDDVIREAIAKLIESR